MPPRPKPTALAEAERAVVQRAQPDRPRDARRRGPQHERHRGAGRRRAGDRARRPGQGGRGVRHGSKRSDASRSPNCGACSACCATPATSGASLSPQPGIADIAAAVAQSSASGVATELVIEGDAAGARPGRSSWPPTAIVQEALTNVRKHAGRVGVGRRCASPTRPTSSTVEVTDDGRGAATSAVGVGRRSRPDRHAGAGRDLRRRAHRRTPTRAGASRVRAVLPIVPSDVTDVPAGGQPAADVRRRAHDDASGSPSSTTRR